MIYHKQQIKRVATSTELVITVCYFNPKLPLIDFINVTMTCGTDWNGDIEAFSQSYGVMDTPPCMSYDAVTLGK